MNLTSFLKVRFSKRLVLFASITFLLMLNAASLNFGATQAANPKPCCAITSVDSTTGMVTAKVNSTGQTFQFKVSDAALLHSLRIGQGIFANFKTEQVSVDGENVCCTITSVAAPQSYAPAPTTPSAPQPGPPPGPNTPCCGITSVDPGKNLASAKENSTGRAFQFKANDPATMRSLKPGENIYANFRNMQVSVDGRNPFGTIVNLAQTGISTGLNQIGTNLQLQLPPKAMLGPPQMIKSNVPTRPIARGPVQYTRLTNTGGYNLVHLHGLIGVKSAGALPQGVRDILFLQAGSLPLGQVDNYIVNVQLAQKWAQTHPEPDYLKNAAKDADSHTGCPDNRCALATESLTTDCAQKLTDYSTCEVKQKTAELVQWFQNEWNQITGQLAKDRDQAQSCWQEQPLNTLNGQVQFSYSPQFPVSFQKSGDTKNPFGKFSGSISGNATFGLPIDANFVAQLQMFYIPCLTIDGVPIYVRPKSIGADGTLGVSETLNANLKASGQFDQTLTVPPDGGVQIPIEVFPITVDGVPIAEMDVSLFVEGTVNANGNGSLDGTVNLQAHEQTAFNFSCDGHGCSGGAHGVPMPTTTTESVQVKGRIQLKPAIYAALQLDLDVDLLSGRVGPEPYLFGEIYGCAAASASQSTSGGSTSQELHALTADVDWGLDLLAEALAGGDQFWKQNWRITGGHLLFKPLAPSNALIPAIAGTTQPPLGKPAIYNIKMPTCYPYADQMEYHLQWTGGATTIGAGAPVALTAAGGFLNNPAGNLKLIPRDPPSCNTAQKGQADCLSDPLNDMLFNLAWPTSGNFSLVVTPVRDKHGRTFDSSDASQVNVSVP